MQHMGVKELLVQPSPCTSTLPCSVPLQPPCGMFLVQEGKNLIMKARIQDRLSSGVNPTVRLLPSGKVYLRRIQSAFEAEAKNSILALFSARLAAGRQSDSPPRRVAAQRALSKTPCEQDCSGETRERPLAVAYWGSEPGSSCCRHGFSDTAATWTSRGARRFPCDGLGVCPQTLSWERKCQEGRMTQAHGTACALHRGGL